MKLLKYILPLLLVFLALASCKTTTDVKPNTPIDTDAFIHQISFNAPTQYSTAAINADTLKIVWYENVTILVPKEGYTLSYALHLKQDFTSSVLVKFHYTTINDVGQVTTDWVDDNLNNITTKSVKDTTVNGKAFVRVNVQRPFTFKKGYMNNQQALAELDSISKLKTDKINFSSYLFFTKTYPATATSTSILYSKDD